MLVHTTTLCTALVTAFLLSNFTQCVAYTPNIVPGGALAGTTVAERSLAARAADSFNVLDNGLMTDCSTDNAIAFAALLVRATAASAASGGQSEVLFPATGTCYGFSSVVAVPTGVRIIGLGRPTLSALGRTGALFSVTNVGNVTMSGLRLDSRSSAHPTIAMPINVSGATGSILLEDIELVNPTGEIHVTNSYGVTISRPVVTGSLLHGVLFGNVYDSEVINGRFQNGIGFGIILTAGSYRNLIQGNRTTASGLELIGVTQDSYENRIIGNHAEGTGDNCISITGYKNIVMGNVAKGCQGNGIEVYGDRNLVVGNSAHNNAKGNMLEKGWRAGIAIRGGFGGIAQYNVVIGNIVDDDQATPTQLYGIWLGSTPYQAWAAGQATKAGTYRYSGLNLYKATTAGTTASAAPDWVNTASDGAVTWQWVRGPTAGTISTDYNEISGNMIARYGTARYLDSGGGTHNEFVGREVPPALTAGALVKSGGVRQTLTGSAYTVAANTSLVRFVQTNEIATQTVTLPAALADGQHIQFVMYSGSVTALTFNPSVNGWINGSVFAASTGLRVRWDATAAAWFREQ